MQLGSTSLTKVPFHICGVQTPQMWKPESHPAVGALKKASKLFCKDVGKGADSRSSCNHWYRNIIKNSNKGLGEISDLLFPTLRRQGARGRWVSVSSRPVWFISEVPGQPGLHSETVSKTKTKTKEGRGRGLQKEDARLERINENRQNYSVTKSQ